MVDKGVLKEREEGKGQVRQSRSVDCHRETEKDGYVYDG